MIAGASWLWWLGFHAAVALLLVADSLLPGHRSPSRPGEAHLVEAGTAEVRASSRHAASVPRSDEFWAWLGTGFFVLVAAGFALWIALAQGRQPALEFVAGYTIEASLSVDNLFVFLVLFQGFQISRRRQHTALLWGVWCAVVLRALFISAGVTLLVRFQWINWIFGLFLLYAAWRLFRGGSARAVIPEWIRRLQPARGSLLPVILAVEVTDLVFATDSIPAVLAVTHNPFVAYTSNIAAILGLRSLYFALAAVLDRFRSLHYGLGALLTFVAFKMLAARWFEIPIVPSLAVIGGILVVFALISLRKKSGEQRGREQGTGNRE